MSEAGNEPETVRSLALCEVLREFRIRAGLSKRALSQKAGLSTSYVGKLEAGELIPSFQAFVGIALALELTSQEVLFCVRCAFAEHLAQEGLPLQVPDTIAADL